MDNYLEVRKQTLANAKPCPNPACGSTDLDIRGITENGNVTWMIQCKRCMLFKTPKDWNEHG